MQQAGRTPPTITNTEGVRFLLSSTHAWMGASETIDGQLTAAEGLVQFQLLAISPNTPFDSVLLPHVGSVLESHACVQAPYARVAAATTDPSFRMPVEPASPQAGNQGDDSSQAAGSQGTGSHKQ